METPLPLAKRILFPLLSIVIGVVALMLFGEVVFRILPTNQGLRAQIVNEAQPIFRFQPNRNAQWSQDWNFKLANRLHVNNAGFVNEQDYVSADKTPLMAVVGDSFIEAAIVPPKATVHARLQSHVGATARVYSFAAAGAGLPQYLIWARHARDTYKPDLVLINIIPNDFDESLHFIEHSPGFWRFEKKPDGSAAWRLTEYDPSLTRRMFRQSALAMYLTLNARLHTLINSKQPVALSFNAKDQRWVGNIAAMAPEERLREYRWAVDRFLEFLPEYSGVATDRIILCFDGYRPQMYANDAGELAFARASTWGKMRAYMMQKAAEAGITTIDLEAVFTAHYAKNRQRFEPPSDNHWNGVGHGALADAVMDTAVFKRVLEPAKSTTSR